MRRTLLACIATAVLTALLTSTAGFATASRDRGTSAHQVWAPPQTTIHFTGGVDLLCVNELASGAPQHLNERGVACTSDASPYLHVALWITRSRISLTKPAFTHTVYAVARN